MGGTHYNYEYTSDNNFNDTLFIHSNVPATDTLNAKKEFSPFDNKLFGSYL